MRQLMLREVKQLVMKRFESVLVSETCAPSFAFLGKYRGKEGIFVFLDNE